jgi:hypothetical protein
MKETRPDLQILFMSGHIDDRLEAYNFVIEPRRFVRKPFSPSRFLKKVRRILDEGLTPDE